MDFLWVVVFESLHTVGTALLVYLVLPDLDVVKGVMLTNCVAFVPGLFGMEVFLLVSVCVCVCVIYLYFR